MEIPAFVVIGIFVICGLALMALEAFVPGFGVSGIAAAVFLGVGIYKGWSTYGPAAGIMLLVGCAVLSFLLVKMVFRSMKTGRLKGIFLQGEERTAVQNVRTTAKLAEGMCGVAATALRPTGIGEFGGERIHVMSDNGFVEAGKRICIICVEGNHISVRKDEDDN